MQRNFLFRVPGQHGMYDFSEIKRMNLSKMKCLEVKEMEKQNCERTVGWMSVEAILAKFG